MVCVGIYAVLVSTIQIADNLSSALFGVAALYSAFMFCAYENRKPVEVDLQRTLREFRKGKVTGTAHPG